jgi:hypothetical protein
MAHNPTTAADTLAGQGTPGACVYIKTLTNEQREKAAQWVLDRFSSFSSDNVVAVLETALKQAKAKRRQSRRKWAMFSHEVDVFRKQDGLTLKVALIMVRDLRPERYGRFTDVRTLTSRYREEKRRYKKRG